MKLFQASRQASRISKLNHHSFVKNTYVCSIECRGRRHSLRDTCTRGDGHVFYTWPRGHTGSELRITMIVKPLFMFTFVYCRSPSQLFPIIKIQFGANLVIKMLVIVGN